MREEQGGVILSEKEDRKDPLRRCIVTGKAYPKDQLIRFVVGPDKEVYPDIAQKLPGRGFWALAVKSVIIQLGQKNFFKAAQKVTVTDNLADKVEALLRKSCLNKLSMAKKAGYAIAGYEKVVAAERGNNAEVTLKAISIEEVPHIQEKKNGCHIEFFTAHELSSALGKEHCVYAAILSSPFAAQIKKDIAQLLEFNRVI